jgi:FdrA protein
MAAFVHIQPDSYHDSVLLMRLSQSLRQLDGVEDAAVIMGTPANRALLREQGYAGVELDRAAANDLVVAVRGEIALESVKAEVDRLLHAEPPPEPLATGVARPTSLRAALEAHPEAGLVLISVPGEHAVREARLAIWLGRHVMLFSDNVPVEDEIALKREALSRHLLLMGPDCGTAIVNGLPLGFANAVRRGPIGIVGAAGTGIQEVSSCIHRLGGGISQAIGTGGRDLSDAVGGMMTLFGVQLLAEDSNTRVLVVVSKPPSQAVAKCVVDALAETHKPAVVHFVGSDTRAFGGRDDIVFARTLAATAEEACRLAGNTGPPLSGGVDPAQVRSLAGRLQPGTWLRGLFCGGTTGQEALAELGRLELQAPVRSNLQKAGPLHVDGTERTEGHLLLDLGDDVFTRGRPHPMLEPGLRNERLAAEMREPEVGLLLFDCVLGFGAHPDPAGVLAAAVCDARAVAGSRGRDLVAIASVTGTPDDPQDSRRQVRELEAADIVVEPSNAAAAALAAAVLGRIAR